MYIRATAVMFPIQEASSQETYRTDLHKLRRRKKNQRSTFWLRLLIEHSLKHTRKKASTCLFMESPDLFT